MYYHPCDKYPYSIGGIERSGEDDSCSYTQNYDALSLLTRKQPQLERFNEIYIGFCLFALPLLPFSGSDYSAQISSLGLEENLGGHHDGVIFSSNQEDPPGGHLIV